MNKALQRIRNFGFLILFFTLTSGVFAQNIVVEGVVEDANDGSTMVGVSILVKGTQKGTVTDINGRYKIETQMGNTLLFSFVGYKTQEIIANKALINIKLSPSVKMLDEVITIGYATQKKSDKTGAVSNIKASELNGGVLTDPIQGLQGKSAGVMISKQGGDPNSGFSVKIRGASGYLASTEPLYVIDGVPGADPTLVAPDDIESYNILKDAASSAIYGSRGSNGVIIITTKRGKSTSGDKNGDGNFNQVNFSSQVSIEKVAKKVDLLTASDMRAFAQKLSQASGKPVDSVFTDGGANTDWQDQIYRTGISTSNNLSFTGGNSKTQYYTSLSNSNWTGVMKGTEKERNIVRVNITHAAMEDKLHFNLNLTAANENNDKENYGGWGKDDIIYQALSRNPTDPVYNADGSYNKASRVFNYENPLAIIDNVENKRQLNSFNGNLKTDYVISKGLTTSLVVGYKKDIQQFNYFRPSGLYSSADNGAGEKKEQNNTQKLVEFYTTYEKTFNKVHNINILGGYTWQQNENDGFFSKGRDAQSDHIGSSNLAIFNEINWGDIGSWKIKSNLISFFGRTQYNYNQKYYVSASLRRDGSSKFGINNKWGMFPTAAIGWNMEKENFMSGLTWLNQLKLRLSYGVSGNQDVGEYRSIVVWKPTGQSVNAETGQKVVTFGADWNANPDLKWEETAELNFGVDFAMFNNKISGTIEVYKKNTTDLLGEYQVPVPPNFFRITYKNTGEMENKGIELFLQTYPVSKKNFVWKTSMNISHNKTIIVDLGSEIQGDKRNEGFISGRGMVGDEYYLIGLIEGQALGAFYLPTFVKIQDGKFIYKSETGGYTDNLSDAERTIVGNATPDLEIGWSNSFTLFKNWSVDFSFRALIGNDVYNATQMFFDNPQILPSLNANQAAIDWYNQGRTASSTIADFYLENATFLRLDYLSVGYNFKFKKSNMIKNLTLYASSNNLFTITGYSGIDPETTIKGLSYGIDQYNVYPKTRTITFGIKGTL